MRAVPDSASTAAPQHLVWRPTCIKHARQERPLLDRESRGPPATAGSRPAALSCGLPSSSPSACASLGVGGGWWQQQDDTEAARFNRHRGQPSTAGATLRTSERDLHWTRAGGRPAAAAAHCHRLHHPTALHHCRRCRGGSEGAGLHRLETTRARWRRWRRRWRQRAAGCRCCRSCAPVQLDAFWNCSAGPGAQQPHQHVVRSVAALGKGCFGLQVVTTDL